MFLYFRYVFATNQSFYIICICIYIFLNVDGPDSVNLNSSSPLTVQEGDDVAVSCEATSCNPSCSYSWKFKSPINPASRVLNLNNIERSSAGVYTCTARNTDIQKSSDKKITVDVQCKLNMLLLWLLF